MCVGCGGWHKGAAHFNQVEWFGEGPPCTHCRLIWFCVQEKPELCLHNPPRMFDFKSKYPWRTHQELTCTNAINAKTTDATNTLASTYHRFLLKVKEYTNQKSYQTTNTIK